MFLTEVGQILSVAGIAVLALLVLVGGKVLLDLASKEIQSRLSELPLLILRVARWRLPRDLRESVHDDWWLPDLQERLQRDEERPITRLVKGLCFAVSLVVKAGRTARAAGAPSAVGRMWKAARRKRTLTDVLRLVSLGSAAFATVVSLAPRITETLGVSWYVAVLLAIGVLTLVARMSLGAVIVLDQWKEWRGRSGRQKN